MAQSPYVDLKNTQIDWFIPCILYFFYFELYTVRYRYSYHNNDDPVNSRNKSLLTVNGHIGHVARMWVSRYRG